MVGRDHTRPRGAPDGRSGSQTSAPPKRDFLGSDDDLGWSHERRRRVEHGGVGTPHSRGASGKVLGASADKASLFSWRLRVAGRAHGRAVRRLGDSSAPRWPAGSPAQWQRPRMWICAGPRDPDTKPSRGRLWVGVRKPRLVSRRVHLEKKEGVSAFFVCACTRARFLSRTTRHPRQ